MSDDDNNSDILVKPSDDFDVDDEVGVTVTGQILMQWKQQWMKCLYNYSCLRATSDMKTSLQWSD